MPTVIVLLLGAVVVTAIFCWYQEDLGATE